MMCMNLNGPDTLIGKKYSRELRNNVKIKIETLIPERHRDKLLTLLL